MARKATQTDRRVTLEHYPAEVDTVRGRVVGFLYRLSMEGERGAKETTTRALDIVKTLRDNHGYSMEAAVEATQEARMKGKVTLATKAR